VDGEKEGLSQQIKIGLKMHNQSKKSLIVKRERGDKTRNQIPRNLATN